MTGDRKHTVLHYVGANDDRGGIAAIVRALATDGRMNCVLGVNEEYQPERSESPEPVRLPSLAGERLSLRTAWRARAVSGSVAAWLRQDALRIFHGHSRAGLMVALWLRRAGERRVVASIHCYGRQRWFYRWAARRLGNRLYWLSPEMKRYYGIATGSAPWSQCIPGCVAESPSQPAVASSTGTLRLGGIGMLVPWKHWELILEALAQLPAAIRARVRFSHIGDATADAGSREYAGLLRAWTADKDLRSVVEWRGQQRGSSEFLREIDCLVVASRNEPLSIAMLEAQRARVPVLAARSGGNCDVIVPPHNGWFFQPDSATDLARVIRELVETDARAKVDFRAVDLSRFDPAVVAAQWIEVYGRLETFV